MFVENALQNLLSPVVLFFLLGIFAGVLKSTLAIPEILSKGVSLYLMMAIGFRGGVELSHSGFDVNVVLACVGAVLLSAVLPIVAYRLLRSTTNIDVANAAAVSAHYGSVSVVTFAAALAVLGSQGQHFEPYLVAMLAVMEAPAIVTGLFLARRNSQAKSLPTEKTEKPRGGVAMKEVLLHGSVLLLLGSFVIGWTTGARGQQDLGPLLDKPFKGILCVFLLDMGLLVARHLRDLKALNSRLVAFGIYMPLIGASLGILLASLLGLSAGGATLLAVLGGSASYIVVPAVMRVALPEASPAIYLTLALVITFPFNLVLGIPLYNKVAHAVLSPTAAREKSNPSLSADQGRAIGEIPPPPAGAGR